MKKYAIVLLLPEELNKNLDLIVNDISTKFDTFGALTYPLHIPLKYGFEYEDEDKLKQEINKFNRTINNILITIGNSKATEMMVYLEVENNPQLDSIRKKLYHLLREQLNYTNFRELELKEEFKYHLTLAEGKLNYDKISKILEDLSKIDFSFSFSIPSLSVLVKDKDKFLPLNLTEENKMNTYEKLINPENPFIIAEIGSNHNGDIEKAKQLIDIAKDAGCDAVKFQSFDYNSLFPQSMLDENKEMTAKDINAIGLENIQKKLALSKDDHIELKRYADEKGILFFSYPLSKKHVDWLVEIDVPMIKVGSPDLPNLQLLKYIAKQGKPIILSVGMGTINEIEDALETIYAEGNKEVVLLHCNAAYPPKFEDVNLKNIPMLKQTFNVPVGFSDHSRSTALPSAAVAFGASVIEKHIMLDNLHCRDEPVSLTPSELRTMVRDVRNVAKSLGSSKKTLSEDEKKRRVAVWGRRSILASREMRAGEIIKEEDLIFKRPGTGISVNKLKYVVGRKLNKDKKVEEQMEWEDLV